MSLPPVLVVDDDYNTRQLLRFILQYEGYRVYQAPDGAAALARLRITSKRWIVLVGIMMPIMDGEQLLRIVAADSALVTRHRYIVVTGTSRVRAPDVQALLATLDAPVIFKPFKPDDILDAVEQARAKMS